jgi:hypothetical protein
LSFDAFLFPGWSFLDALRGPDGLSDPGSTVDEFLNLDLNFSMLVLLRVFTIGLKKLGFFLFFGEPDCFEMATPLLFPWFTREVTEADVELLLTMTGRCGGQDIVFALMGSWIVS